ncbi:terminase family protein [Tsukamurella sp. 8F]|nr:MULTISPECIES: terminase family protein [unclassified Tsukamurella]MDF0532526.1 terminase family protein [Tsukamurella sp. 8J]MDF0588096.1 terminase family protein [Tsukamurella sp. 8F]
MPATALLSDLAARSVREPDRRDIVSTPPRAGKSRLLSIWTVVWALHSDPDREVLLTSYSDELAQSHSREVRALIQEHGAELGLAIASDKSSVGRWRIEGRRGGLLAGGINSGATGFGAHVLIIDDPIKDAAEADSAAHRKRILNEFRSTYSTRVYPGGSILLVQTRWHEADLAGALLADEPELWSRVNIPAVAEVGIQDALGREPGQAMTSALGFTAEHFASARRTAGERAWWSLYMGEPSSPEGGLVKREWFDQWRMATAPVDPVRTVVAVDPADSGHGDDAGIIAASATRDGVVALIADRSAPMTSDAWARTALELAVEVGASEVAVEAFASRETYRRIMREAIERHRRKHPDTAPIRVSMWPEKGRGAMGDALARSGAMLQAFETGTCRVAGHLPKFEEQALRWQRGQHQPDGLAAAVVAHDLLAAGQGMVLGLPTNASERARMLRRRITG